jgi:hypothetical protein
MLTKENAVGFAPCYHYPTYEYRRQGGKKGACDGSRIVPTPEGYTEVIRYHDEDEDFQAYLLMVIEEHTDLPDAKLLEAPPFIGRGRNARWLDARKARGLS